MLGGVFLCVTGAEALYADMGHIGARAIRLAWYCLVLPALVLNYAGQTAIVLAGAAPGENVFYQLCPPALLMPLIVLATVATIIASQSIITGAFSMTRQAILLGWCPRLSVSQTSSDGYGQIYVGAVNWVLMIATVGLALAFGSSDNLASAYGIAVSLTMLLTTMLLFVAMRDVWQWSIALSATVAGVFFCVDGAFFLANAVKIVDGGWVPLALALAVFVILTTWHRGTTAVMEGLQARAEPVDRFMAGIAAAAVPRVPGTAIFLTRTTTSTPPVMVWHVKHSRALHRYVVALTVVTESVPWVAPADRVSVTWVAPDMWRVTGRYGFIERPDVPALLAEARQRGCAAHLDDITYYVGHETVFRRTDHAGLPAWQEALYAAMQRNSAHASEFFNIPRDAVVEIGRQVEI